MQEIWLKIKGLFKVPMLLVFVIICIAFLPDAVNTPSVVFRTAIVVAFGIDATEDNQYEIHAAINVSAKDESLSENTKLMSAVGDSVSQAITNLSVQFGRAIRFGHTRFMLIGTNLAKQNIAKVLDGVIRTNKMRDTIHLVLCDSDVADMLNVGIEIKNKTGIKLSDIITYQSPNSTVSMDSNIDTFYKGYFSNAGISKIACISLTDDYTKGITPEAALGEATSPQAPDAGNEETGAGKTQEKKKKFVSSMGRVGVFKNGILSQIIDAPIAEGTQWINSSYLPKKLEVDVNNNILDNAQLFFQVFEKTVSNEVFFYKGIPMLSAKIDVTLGIDEILNGNNNIIPLSQDVVDQEVKCAIGRKIRTKTAEALKFSRDNNLDILELNEIFYLSNYREYIDYLKSGKSVEDFINEVQVSLEIRVKVI